MADDYGSMVSRIRTDLNRGSAHDNRIRQAIIDALRFYRASRFGWNQKRAETLIQNGDEFLDLPPDWIEVDFLSLEDDNTRDPLNERTYDWIEERTRSRDQTGRPTDYAIQNRQLRFYPAPDRSYSLVMSLLYELQNVSISASDGATNAWMSEGEELIRKHAMADLLVNYIKGDEIPNGLVLKTEVKNEIVPALEARAAREQSSGKIKAFL